MELPPSRWYVPVSGVVPLAVPPPDHFPQQMEQPQYAVSLNLPRYLPCVVSMVSSELSVVVVEVVVFAAVLLVVVVVVVLLFDFFCVADAAAALLSAVLPFVLLHLLPLFSLLLLLLPLPVLLSQLLPVPPAVLLIWLLLLPLLPDEEGR